MSAATSRYRRICSSDISTSLRWAIRFLARCRSSIAFAMLFGSSSAATICLIGGGPARLLFVKICRCAARSVILCSISNHAASTANLLSRFRNCRNLPEGETSSILGSSASARATSASATSLENSASRLPIFMRLNLIVENSVCSSTRNIRASSKIAKG